MDKNEALNKLLELKLLSKEFPSFKGKAAILNKIEGSINFINNYACNELYSNFVKECQSTYDEGMVIMEELSRKAQDKMTQKAKK